MTDEYDPTQMTRVKRYPNRARYDRETVHAILDAGFYCHVGYNFNGRPYVAPTIYWRHEETIYWHASSAGRMERLATDGADACVNVSIVDGLVLARSTFHHSVNYRSVVAFGKAVPVKKEDEKLAALTAFVERLYPGRSEQARMPTKQELKATMVLSMELNEVSAKVRTGGPVDEVEDYSVRCWAGVIPLRTVVEAAQPDERLASDVAVPDYVSAPPLFR